VVHTERNGWLNNTLCASDIGNCSELFGMLLCHFDTAALVKALIGALHSSIS